MIAKYKLHCRYKWFSVKLLGYAFKEKQMQMPSAFKGKYINGCDKISGSKSFLGE